MIPKRFRKYLIIDIVILFLLLAWINPFAPKQSIDTNGWEQVIPSDKLDERIICQKSNNNLDIVQYKDQYFVGFRTAPTHFASKKTKLYIMSSPDLNTWKYEHEIHLGNDMREPRFSVFQDTLRMYFFEGGKRATKFEPQHIWMTKYLGASTWSELEDMKLDGYVDWRLRERDDTLYLSAYYGRNLYSKDHIGDQRLFYSTNGSQWDAVSVEAQLTNKGVEEGEFIFDSTGSLWGTVRLEGSGAMVVHAPEKDLSTWTGNPTKDKYDSALLFDHKGEFYLIARRNMDGISAKSSWRLYNLLRYSFTRKKTALYHLNRNDLKVDWMMDFPSTGDNSFPGIVSLGNGKYFLLNYSSNIYGKEKNWFKGQLQKTYIYRTILDMDEIVELNSKNQ